VSFRVKTCSSGCFPRAHSVSKSRTAWVIITSRPSSFLVAPGSSRIVPPSRSTCRARRLSSPTRRAWDSQSRRGFAAQKYVGVGRDSARIPRVPWVRSPRTITHENPPSFYFPEVPDAEVPIPVNLPNTFRKMPRSRPALTKTPVPRLSVVGKSPVMSTGTPFL
jgi:hypothetical protein